MTAASTSEGTHADRGPGDPEVERGHATKPKAVDRLLTPEEIETCDVLEHAKDKLMSRTLQRTLLKGDPEAAKKLRQRVEPFLLELSVDMYGNYVAQTILQVSDESTFAGHFQNLSGRLLELSEDMHGTRITQKVVEQAVQHGMVNELVQVLTPKTAGSLSCNMTGFHVVVKLLELLPDDAVQPYLDLLCRDPKTLAMDQWGCNLLKKCLDRSKGQLFQSIVDVVFENALELVQDPFGNYIIQHLLAAEGDRSNCSRIVDALHGKVLDMCMEKVSSNVLEKCLKSSSQPDRNKIINEILNGSEQCPPSEAVRRIVFHQFGNYVFQKALEVAEEPQFSLLVTHCRKSIQDVICAELPKADSEEQAVETPAVLKAPSTLSQEPAKRLACKLAKRHPELLLDLKWDQLGEGAEALASALGLWYQPWHGFDDAMASGYAPFWDPSVDLAWQFQALESEAATKQGRLRGENVSRRSSGPWQRQDRKKKDNSTVKVPRVVGYWPNYSVTYDEVPVQKQAARSKGGKGKAKA